MFKSPSRNVKNQGVTTVFQFASNTLARKRLGHQLTDAEDVSSHIPLHRKVNLKRLNSSPSKIKNYNAAVQKRNAIAGAIATEVPIRKVNKKLTIKQQAMRGIQDFKRQLYNQDIIHLNENAISANQSPVKGEKIVRSEQISPFKTRKNSLVFGNEHDMNAT